MSLPPIHVVVIYPDGQKNEQMFHGSFRLGRDADNELYIPNPSVSRNHAEVVFLADTWWIRDIHSANGIYVNGHKVDRHPLTKTTEVSLGEGGVQLVFQVEEQREKATEKQESRTEKDYQKYYFGDENDEDIGERTMMVRKAFKNIQKKQKRRYGGIIAVITCLFVIAGSVAVFKHQQVKKQKKLASEIFYTMKGLEVKFADILQKSRETEDTATITRVEQYKQQARELENSYSEFVDTLGIYDNISPQDQAILKTARIFGECEILVPADFTSEVMRYIKKWQSTERLTNALKRANARGYTSPIARTMLYYYLPPQFFYLALQESNFNTDALGPKTRWGIAKGMWQFIPETGARYGLRTGPLFEQRKVDPLDERHNFAKSTVAAAKYLRKIYDTDAQASGLLVMASYNWGENRVIRLIRGMPNNPQDRNFWQFFKQYRDKMPKQTYDYVFYIFSASVIGENPSLFGFNFDNPLNMTVN